MVPAGHMVRILMEDNSHIAKMILDAIRVCDKNRDSHTSNQLQDILDDKASEMVPLRTVAGIKEH